MKLEMTLAAGSRLGGAGGMGEVYKAKDTRLDRTVAVKVLPSHLSENAELRQRFEREAKTISSLSHPHICALYDVGEAVLSDGGRGALGDRRLAKESETEGSVVAATARMAVTAFANHARRSRPLRRAATGAGTPACEPPSAIPKHFATRRRAEEGPGAETG